MIELRDIYEDKIDKAAAERTEWLLGLCERACYRIVNEPNLCRLCNGADYLDCNILRAPNTPWSRICVQRVLKEQMNQEAQKQWLDESL